MTADVAADPIPLVDLGWQQRAVAREVAEGWERVLRSTAFIDGPDVTSFEEEFAAFCGRRECIGVSNGTDAIELMLRAANVGAGDAVVTPANTFVATVEAIVRAGARPVLVDCEPVGLLVDPARVHDALAREVRAVLPVHLYGQLAPMEELAETIGDGGVLLLEDAAQAQGASRCGAGIGSVGHAAATSFYPGKNLGAYGDAGAVVTDDPALAARLRVLRNHGSAERYRHDVLGFNCRLDTLQAVVLRAKLRRLNEWNDRRRAAAAYYDELLSGLDDVVLPGTAPGNTHVWHLYVVRVRHRDAVLAGLHARGVAAGIHYPVPVHLHAAFRDLGNGPGSFPVAEAAAAEILSLPIFPGIDRSQQERVVEALYASLVGA
ncbi:MAG: DegT/DnrJ/EryC1/StrS family aminotransferase [Acidimicrobiia bacterium]